MKTISIKGLFQSDTKRFHRFDLTGNGIVGNLYVPRGDEGPDIVEAEVKTRADETKTGFECNRKEG